MRPVKKWSVEDTDEEGNRVTHHYTDSKGNKVLVEKEYTPYRKAYTPLTENVGLYCSYCESTNTYFEIEHVIPKKQINDVIDDTGDLTENTWSNLLLACKHCNNGTGCKRDGYVYLDQILLPHQDNTYDVFDYLEGGVLKLKDDLEPSLKKKAQALVDLFSLDRNPDETGVERDHRLSKRSAAWDAIVPIKKWYVQNPVPEMIPKIQKIALATAHFSIWHTIFQDHPEVQQALVDAFPGTNKAYFL